MKASICRLVGAMALGCGLLAGGVLPAGAAYPDKPITLVVPFPPGGAVDTLGRLFGDKLSEFTGQSVIVENKAGANGNIGTEAVVRAAPDGYTLLIAANGMATNPSIYTKRSFDETKDLSPVAYLGYAPLILVTAYDSSYKTFDDLLKDARSNPGKVSFATSGSGSAPHLASELLRLTTKTDMMHVPYRGGAPAKLDLVTGRVSFMLLNPLEAVPQVEGKKLRALMVDSAERLPQLPDVPTAKELGFKDIEARVWWGFSVPKGTPADRIEVLNKHITSALKDPKVQEKLKQMAVTTTGGSVKEFEDFYDVQVKKWADVVSKAGISAQ